MFNQLRFVERCLVKDGESHPFFVDQINIIFVYTKNPLMSYFIYTNWQAADNRFDRLHHSSCGHCNAGSGKHPESQEGSHGVWIGPFAERKFAEEFHINKIRTGKPLTSCSHCREK